MKFKSEFKGQVFWRTFAKADTVYVIGLREGTVGQGGSAEYNHPSGFFQMELKRGGLFGSTLMPAGHVFANEDEYLLTSAGSFVSVDEGASVTLDAGFKFQNYGGVVQFFTEGSADSIITVTSTITQTVTQTGSSQATVSSEATDETNAQVGGKETASGGDKLKLGIEATESVSQKMSSKISRSVSTQLGINVTTQSTYTETQPITLKANKLTVVETSWQRRYVTGSVVFGTLHFQFDATLGYLSSRKVSEYDSPDALPPGLRAAYSAQNPDYRPPVELSDGRVLRDQDAPEVMVIFGGAKFWVPSPDVLFRLYGGWASVNVVPNGTIAAIPAIPKDGTILREENHPEVWLMEGGNKRHITTPAVLGRYGGWGSVHVVPDGATGIFPEGDPVT